MISILIFAQIVWVNLFPGRKDLPGKADRNGAVGRDGGLGRPGWDRGDIGASVETQEPPVVPISQWRTVFSERAGNVSG